MELKCCEKPVKTGKKAENGKTIYAVWCTTCGRRGTGENDATAVASFQAAKPTAGAMGPGPSTALGFPASPAELPAYVASHMAEITAVSAAFVERPALLQMVKRNVRYVVTNKTQGFLKLWSHPEGQESIIRALEDAFSLGATLPEMGSIVPYGTTCEFIPAVECYEFALTHGRSAPFEWINIECIYASDQVEVSRKNGDFTIEFRRILPDRGELIAIAVYGAYTKGGRRQVIGELYDAERLLEKARAHSQSYQAYQRNLVLFELARTEGRVKLDAEGREFADVQVESKDGGKYAEQDRQNFEAAEKAGGLKKDAKGEYAEVEIPKKGGGTWKKKIYRADVENPGTETKRLYKEDIVNPYDGPDRPEMLRKAAGKSFLAKYVRVRNSVAAMEDLRKSPETVDDALDQAMDAAFSQFTGVAGTPAGETVDGEYRVEEDPETAEQTGKRMGEKEEEKAETLF
jgi:hypothetical protein